ncbi:ATPase regulatory factor involved in DnaA inactivation [Legionella birminghamensis]|uniref:ATPase regulatory factor involved in DnaA inactivation n=1 Tax=Legionella birminghamensis TaxID=28083 RepID=A0A378I731_9GAMM|nr:DnaA regulatory inactivator Hda [Legionella birminghamensis]KTC72434.1 ATPase regulatory factor involved in DnaA inactivation [Legionella birminghamensis]STX30566.1 ATPase regulatory factor involved in DnaA inactivation [Legionella birminghamensis]
MTRQLVLEIQQNYDARLSDFCWGSNALLAQQIHSLFDNKTEPYLFIWGESGSGKSHLLQACCQMANSQNLQSAYLPLSLLKTWGPACLEGMEQQQLIAIDDINEIAGDSVWEEAIFHLFNKIRDNDAHLLISSTTSPAASAISLPDLRSRLAWGLTYHLEALNDDSKIKVVQQAAEKRGFQLKDSVALYLIKRCTRNLHDLLQILEQLDEASLAAQRKITIPFVKETLGI